MRNQILSGAFLMTSLLCVQAPVPADKLEILSRPVALRTFNGTSGAAIADLLAGTHVQGGIISVYSRCATPSEYQFSFRGATLEQELNYISSVDTSRKWVYRDGGILVGPELRPRTILNVAINDIDINSADALSLSSQRLFQSPEVRDRVNAMGLVEAMAPVSGFYALPNTNAPTETSSAPLSKHFHQLSVADALDAITSMKGKNVWHYEQFECGSKPIYRITWVVRSP